MFALLCAGSVVAAWWTLPRRSDIAAPEPVTIELSSQRHVDRLDLRVDPVSQFNPTPTLTLTAYARPLSDDAHLLLAGQCAALKAEKGSEACDQYLDGVTVATRRSQLVALDGTSAQWHAGDHLPIRDGEAEWTFNLYGDLLRTATNGVTTRVALPIIRLSEIDAPTTPAQVTVSTPQHWSQDLTWSAESPQPADEDSLTDSVDDSAGAGPHSYTLSYTTANAAGIISSATNEVQAIRDEQRTFIAGVLAALAGGFLTVLVQEWMK